jgi:hypothetical protein
MTPEHTSPRLVLLWSPPRCMSTAFLRMMIERGDFLVIHEPFSSIVVQGHTTVCGRTVTRPTDLLALLRDLSSHTRVFVKETTEYRYPIVDHDDFPSLGTHTFIVRHPRDVIASHHAMNPNVTCAEIGFEHQLEIFERVRRVVGYPPAIVEGERLVTDPYLVVRRYCNQIGIPFCPKALSWRPEDRAEWRRTRRWHTDVARSRGFQPIEHRYPVRVDNDPRLAGFYRYQFPFYEALRSYATSDSLWEAAASA